MFVPWSAPNDPLYAYLLGSYPGDGYLSAAGQLVVVCDAAWPGIIRDVHESMLVTSRRTYAGICRHSVEQTVRVTCHWQGWFEALPQHGAGRKHQRPIVLERWQQDIVDEWPWLFLRGLLHSDGCRTVNRFKTKLPSGRVAEYEYPRWFFSNLSADIRGLFCATCEQLGLRWTQSNHRNISISHRHSVALLDEHVGPKT